MLPPLNLLSLRNEELANLAQSLQQLHVSLHKQRTLNNNVEHWRSSYISTLSLESSKFPKRGSFSLIVTPFSFFEHLAHI